MARPSPASLREKPLSPMTTEKLYKCTDEEEDGYLTLSTETETRTDLKIPDALELSNKIRQMLADEMDFNVVVQVVDGVEQIVDVKVISLIRD